MVDFLVIGNGIIACTNDNVLSLFKDKKIMYGYSISSGYRFFEVPDDYEFYGTVCKEEEGKRFIAVSGVRWFTSMREDYPSSLVLTRKYEDGDYKKIDDSDILFIEKTEDIPIDYYGLMGVPVTFLDKWNPDQFDIMCLYFDPPVDGVIKYRRILIKRK